MTKNLLPLEEITILNVGIKDAVPRHELSVLPFEPDSSDQEDMKASACRLRLQ